MSTTTTTPIVSLAGIDAALGVGDVSYVSRNGAAFAMTTRGYAECHTHRDYGAADGSPRDVIGSVEVTYYGAYDYGDHTDRAARFVVRHHFGEFSTDRVTRSTLLAQRWTGSRFENMPEGGRVDITRQIAARLAAVDWQAIAAEAWAGKYGADLDRLRAAVARAQDELDRFSAPAMPPLAGQVTA